MLTLLGSLGDKEVAERLHVGKETVHTHMVNVLRKTGRIAHSFIHRGFTYSMDALLVIVQYAP